MKDKLNLGCGRTMFEDFVNVDKQNFHKGHPDFVCHDLEVTPLPFEDSSFAEIEAHQIMEHVHNFIPLMNECHRILKPGGQLTISSPFYPHEECFQDPTHVRFFTKKTWHYFYSQGILGEFGESYGIKLFSQLKMGTHPQADWNLFVQFIK